MNKMIKFLFLAATTVCIGSANADSYLYWLVGDAGPYAGADYAKIAFTTDDGATATYLVNGNPGAAVGQENFYNFMVEQYALIGSTELGSSYKFFVELYSDTDGKLGVTQMLAYDAIKNAIGPDFLSITDQAKFSAAIPEPTSGMLALLGFGLLALRRKQKKA